MNHGSRFSVLWVFPIKTSVFAVLFFVVVGFCIDCPRDYGRPARQAAA